MGGERGREGEREKERERDRDRDRRRLGRREPAVSVTTLLPHESLP